MIDKEVAELRRRLKPESCAITTLYGYYINETGTIISEFQQSMGLLPQAAQEKYLDLLKKALSGRLGKTLTDVSFSTEQVGQAEEHKLLMRLRDTACEDEEARQTLCAHITASFHSSEPYLILMAADAYDVPSRGSGFDDSEQSDSMFRYLLCCVCPVKEAPPVLRYDAQSGAFEARTAERTAAAPLLGFLFPAFDDRATNIYGALYYTKGGEGSYDELYETLFRQKPPMPVPAQKEAFCDVLTDSLEEACALPLVQAVHSGLRELVQTHKEARIPEPLAVTREDVSELLEEVGLPENRLAAFHVRFDEAFGNDAAVPPQNLIGTERLEYRTPSAVLRLPPDREDLVSMRTLGGVHYLLLNVDEGVSLNGIPIHMEEQL